MIALDTNVVVRILTADDAGQLAAARQALRSQPLFLAKTVLLETEWVLRYSYELSRQVIDDALHGLIRLRGMEVEELAAVTEALIWYSAGMDFADALHLASCKNADRFLTFDHRLAAAAKTLRCMPSVELLQGKPLPDGSLDDAVSTEPRT